MTTESLSDVIEGFGEDTRPVLTVGQMLEQFDSRAFGAMLLVFGLLNCLPLPPGSSTILSLPILLLAPQIAWGSDIPWLPRKLVEHPLKRDDLRGLFRRLTPIVRRMELVTRPRLEILFGRVGERLIGVVCTLLALVLVLPIPLGNLAPGATVAVLALALLQRDGLLALLGYLMASISVGLLVVSAGVVTAAVQRLLHMIPGLF
ncbi:exopolysaccharide biosynthesis protein exod [Caulobacter sp. Root1455]|uniref:exopolysaccharide biosynthesis protein n=1 Tax=unclassified Caulobacter TaxID=2648921 RepID=UPI0006F9ADF9|nr:MULTISPECIES: exopolysaccharide biosynthesis protein [unclassified Caulobacter]KQY35242.1 exopolysaccharide biosynthesis protein exod [Caulobacter sp. Root487D2Y]KQY93218.1 exopolysaccharide biosynthesis protein exod [Caulobacter sp. Root1455]